MQKKITGNFYIGKISTLILMFCCIFLSNDLNASHSMGADLSYDCLGDTDFDGLNEYQFSLSFYRDCDGISAPINAPITIESQSCGEVINITLEYDYFQSGGIENQALLFDFPSGNNTGVLYFIAGSDLLSIDVATMDTTIMENFIDVYSYPTLDGILELDSTFDASNQLIDVTGTIVYSGFGGFTDIILNPEDAVYSLDNEVSQVCPEDALNTSCNNGSIPGVEQYVYTATFELPEECDDWIISYSVGTRNALIDNLVAPDSENLYVEALLSNEDGLCNSSPDFSSLPVPYLCVGQQSFYNHGVFDVDGNTLVFTLVDPLTASNTPIDFEYGYTADNPVTTAPGGFSFDPTSGQMVFTPLQEEVCVVAVLVEEFDDNGNLIGSTIRDIQIVIVDCDNEQTFLDGGVTGLNSDAILIDSTTVEVCPGSPVIFDINGQDPDVLDSLFMNTNLASAIPNATFVTTGSNPIQGHFEWIPTIDDVGLNSFSVVLQDNACPIPSSQIFGFNIFVLEGANAGPDQTFCNSGGPATVTASGGSIFTWTSDQVNDGIISISPNGDEMVVAPPQTTTYYLETNLTSNCIIYDTVVVFWSPDFDYTFPEDQSICKFNEVQLNYDVDPADGPYTFQWFPFDYLSENQIQDPLAIPYQTITYNCIATAATGCTVQEEVTITVQGVAPIVNIVEGIDQYVCAGDETQLAVKTCCIDCEIAEYNNNYGQTPFFTGWDDQKLQLLFLADELIDIGMNGCAITGLSFNVVYDGNNIPFGDFTISMENVLLTDLNMAAFFPPGQQVYQNDVDPVLGWNELLFDTPFGWDGGSNVLITLCFDNPDGSWSTQNDCDVSNHLTPFESVFQQEADNSAGCTLNATFPTINSTRPDVRFKTDGTAPGTISWTPAVNFNNPTIADPIVITNETTLYTIEVSDNGCVGEDTITINVIQPQGYEAGPDTAICGDGLFNLFINGPANPNFVYTWEPPTNLSDPNIASPVLSVSDLSESITYVVTITNTGSCDVTDTVTIQFGNDINYYVPPDDTICLGDTYPITINGGDIYEWTPETGLSCYDCPTPIASPDSTTTYTISISTFESLGIDCPIEEEFTLYVNPVPNVDVGFDQEFYKGEPVQLQATGEFLTIEWDPADGVSDSSIANPTFYLEEDANLYVTVENEYQCFDFDTIYMRYLGCRSMVVPTAFSPNGDGQNDLLRIIQTGETEYVDFTIYNRWGENVFTSIDPLSFWNGKYNGKSAEMGTYVWISRNRCDTQIITKRGNVTLVR